MQAATVYYVADLPHCLPIKHKFDIGYDESHLNETVQIGNIAKAIDFNVQGILPKEPASQHDVQLLLMSSQHLQLQSLYGLEFEKHRNECLYQGASIYKINI